MKRIGFIAMSGVRAHNAELTRLGLTLPGFVDRNQIIASLPSLGLLTLAGLTPEKFHVHTIVRTPNGNDYGMDLLRLHYETAPHHKVAHPHHRDKL